jgi:hypothetical protein
MWDSISCAPHRKSPLSNAHPPKISGCRYGLVEASTGRASLRRLRRTGCRAEAGISRVLAENQAYPSGLVCGGKGITPPFPPWRGWKQRERYATIHPGSKKRRIRAVLLPFAAAP